MTVEYRQGWVTTFSDLVKIGQKYPAGATFQCAHLLQGMGSIGCFME